MRRLPVSAAALFAVVSALWVSLIEAVAASGIRGAEQSGRTVAVCTGQRFELFPRLHPGRERSHYWQALELFQSGGSVWRKLV